MGREYAVEDPRIGQWRDIQIEITGDAARKFQMIFADDCFLRRRKSYSMHVITHSRIADRAIWFNQCRTVQTAPMILSRCRSC